ncbi:hypothetical protein [Ekhidna sp.]|uniref:hypothetical protein n=1 Tax=Ekhidna sp. TaxID=2608089 RepID=UPI0032EA964E
MKEKKHRTSKHRVRSRDEKGLFSHMQKKFDRNLRKINEDLDRCIAFIKGVALLDMLLDNKKVLLIDDKDSAYKQLNLIQNAHFTSKDIISQFYQKMVIDTAIELEHRGSKTSSIPISRKKELEALHVYLTKQARTVSLEF